MKRYTYIALGGILGAMARFFVKNVQLVPYKGAFPLNTFIINITGSFILAFLLTAAGIVKLDEDLKLGIGTGFLGAYTTFSSMSKEAVVLVRGRRFDIAVLYLLLSVIIGLLAAYLGYLCSLKAVQKFKVKRPMEAVNEIVVSEEEE